MPTNVTAYDLFISCPSDVAEFLPLIEKKVASFNRLFGRQCNIVVRPIHFSKDSYSTFGKTPQELVNEQLLYSSDLLMGIFWTRFGTPTKDFGSGTQEEIEKAISMGKQVFLYFLDKEINPSMIDFEQYNKVKAFREKMRNDGINFKVNDEEKLVKKFGDDLELYFLRTIIEKIDKPSKGSKKILWVDDNPENNVYERKLLESYNLEFNLALSTKQALHLLKHDDFSLIISDMGRKEGNNEGFNLLKTIRKNGCELPFVIYTYSNDTEKVNESLKFKAQGYTNNRVELIHLIFKILLNN